MLGYTDLRVDNDGDLQVDGNGDLKLADTRRTVAQDVIFRVRTQQGDYNPHPGLGANLTNMIGKPNTRYNGSMIQDLVTRALTIDSRFSPGEFMIDVIPVSDTAVNIVIVFSSIFPDASDNNPLVVSFELNYSSGDITMAGNMTE